MRKKMLAICCTRNRSELAKRMAMSLRETSTEVELFFVLDADEPQLDLKNPKFGYGKWLNSKPHFAHGVCANVQDRTTTMMINAIFREYCNYDFYSVTNDDVIYKTQDWDKRLMELAVGGISYGNDMCQGENMLTISVVDGRIPRALSWLQMPTLTHLYGDCVWRAIGERLKIIKYDKNVITEHRHFMYNKKTEKDETYCKTNASAMYRADHLAFTKWVKDCLVDDCNKIKEALL